VQEPRAFQQYLLREQILDGARLERALAEAEKNGLDLVEVIPQLGYTTQETVYRALADF